MKRTSAKCPRAAVPSAKTERIELAAASGADDPPGVDVSTATAAWSAGSGLAGALAALNDITAAHAPTVAAARRLAAVRSEPGAAADATSDVLRDLVAWSRDLAKLERDVGASQTLTAAEADGFKVAVLMTLLGDWSGAVDAVRSSALTRRPRLSARSHFDLISATVLRLAATHALTVFREAYPSGRHSASRLAASYMAVFGDPAVVHRSAAARFVASHGGCLAAALCTVGVRAGPEQPNTFDAE